MIWDHELVLVRQLRPKQWAKNLLVFVPLLFSGKITDFNAGYAALLCLWASARFRVQYALSTI